MCQPPSDRAISARYLPFRCRCRRRWHARGGGRYRNRCGCSKANTEIIECFECYNCPSSVQITPCDAISRLHQRQLWRERQVRGEDFALPCDLDVVVRFGCLLHRRDTQHLARYALGRPTGGSVSWTPLLYQPLLVILQRLRKGRLELHIAAIQIPGIYHPHILEDVTTGR